jgi:hypothetical protein
VTGISESAEVLFVNGADVPIAHKHADHMVILRGVGEPDGGELYYTPDEWEAFILGVKDGEFDGMAGEPEATASKSDETGGEQGTSFPWTGRPGFSASGQSGG